MGSAEQTIQNVIAKLTKISQLCDINEPEAVKETLATIKWKNSTKRTFTAIYNGYVKYIGKKWQKPKYKPEERIPFIPTEQEIDQLIASAPKLKTASLLQFLKETASRIGEALRTQWIDIDTERKTVHINKPEKGSNARILPISPKLIGMLSQLPRNTDLVFPSKAKSVRTRVDKLKIRTASKLNNPRIKQISFHTFRHWKATMEYHETKDIIHVKTMLGHKRIDSTMIYINIEQALFLFDCDQWTSIVIHNIDEETKAVEANFTLVRSINETTAIYKKRK
jgi:integrase